MRRALLTFAALISLSAASFAQPINPHVPGEPLLPKPGDRQPDAGPGDQQVPDLQVIPDKSPGGAKGQNQAKAPAPKPPETDDQILAKLAKAADKRAARPFERELQARWSHSGSPSADLLYKHADQAMQAHDFDTARQIAQKLTDIAPEFAEAWHLRATLASQKDDYEDAIASLRRALTLRPKHFMAMAELGEILEEYNDKPHALEAYRQAKALDPFIDGLDDRIRDLTKTVEGQGI